MSQPARGDLRKPLDIVLWIVAVVSSALTIGFSVLPPPTVATSTMSDKPWHFLAYFVTVGSLLLAAVWRPGRGDGRFPRAGIWIVVGAIVVGIALELVQGSLLDRQMEFVDAIADTLGTLAAYGAWAGLRRWVGSGAHA